MPHRRSPDSGPSSPVSERLDPADAPSADLSQIAVGVRFVAVLHAHHLPMSPGSLLLIARIALKPLRFINCCNNLGKLFKENKFEYLVTFEDFLNQQAIQGYL
jgi:hypothetical protein